MLGLLDSRACSEVSYRVGREEAQPMERQVGKKGHCFPILRWLAQEHQGAAPFAADRSLGNPLGTKASFSSILTTV